jgi:hypothetical protein
MSNLPAIQDLYLDKKKAQDLDKLVAYLNQSPDPSWVKVHPQIRNFKYIPIERIEYLLKSLFKMYKIEVLETKMILNSVQCTVRVHYFHPIQGEWMYHDGVGAKELQTQKESGHLKLDMSNINRGAVEMAVGIAKTVAIKDACDHFGKLFGSDLNRKDDITYGIDLKLYDFNPQHPNWNKAVAAVKSGDYKIEDVQKRYKDMTAESLQDFKLAIKL